MLIIVLRFQELNANNNEYHHLTSIKLVKNHENSFSLHVNNKDFDLKRKVFVSDVWLIGTGGQLEKQTSEVCKILSNYFSTFYFKIKKL